MSARPINVSMSAQVAEYEQGMLKAARATRATGNEIEKLEQKREAFNTLGASALASGTAMVAMSVLSAKAAMDWESAWAGVTKTVDGTPAQLAEVEDGLRDLTSVLPAAHEEIAAVAEAAGQLGIETPNVVGFTRTMIDLGETTNLSANDAATALARFVNIMGTSQSQVSNLGSALVGLGNNYATTESEILEMSLRLAGAGAQIGLTEGEVLGLSTALSSVGIEAEAGGSAMSKVMIDIAASVESGGDQLDKFASAAGLSAEDFAAKWRSEPAAALALFVKGLSNAESQGQSTLGILADLGITEVRMRDALLRSSAAADQFAGAMAMGNEEFDKNNALTEEAAKRYETVEARIAMAGNAIRDAAIEFGEVFLAPVGEAADAVANIARTFGDLPDPVQGAIAILTGVVGVTALAGGAALLAVPKIAAFKVSMDVLGISGATARSKLGGLVHFLGSPWGIAMLAATAAVVSFTAAIEAGVPSQAEISNALNTTEDSVKGLEAAFARGDFESTWMGDYADQLKDMPHLLDRATEAGWRWAELTFNEQGALDSLKRYGDALSELATTNLPAASARFADLVEAYDLTDEQAQQLLKEMPAFRDALLKQAEGLEITGDSAEFLAFALGEMEGPTSSTQQAMVEMEEAAAEADAALQGTATALAEIAGQALNLGEAKDAALSAINAMTEAASAEDVALDGANDASIRLRDTVRDVETAHRDSAQAIIDAGGTLEEAQGEWQRGRDSVLQMLEAMGMAPEEAAAWADAQLGASSDVKTSIDEMYQAWLNMPENVSTKYEVESAAAEAKLQALKDRLASIPEIKRITLESYDYGTKTVSAGENETGNFYAYANGGIASNVPSGIYPGGAEIHKFAEKSLPWEAYISPKADQRERNRGVWMEAGNRLGFLGGQQASGQPPTVVEQHFHLQPGLGPDDVRRIARERETAAVGSA